MDIEYIYQIAFLEVEAMFGKTEWARIRAENSPEGVNLVMLFKAHDLKDERKIAAASLLNRAEKLKLSLATSNDKLEVDFISIQVIIHGEKLAKQLAPVAAAALHSALKD